MEVAADHPGRQAFCTAYGRSPRAPIRPARAWRTLPGTFHGRPFGSSGPGRRMRRESRTQRVAASVDGDFTAGGRDAHWDVGLSYSRARGNLNLPGVYRDRIFRAFRGFGGPDCGVGVAADRTSPAGMSLGPLGGAAAGRGPCMYYNPFSNAIQYSDQPGARFRSTPNPDYVPALANPEALRQWLNEEVDLVSTTDLFVADATLSGNLVDNRRRLRRRLPAPRHAGRRRPERSGRRDSEPLRGGGRPRLRTGRPVRAVLLHRRSTGPTPRHSRCSGCSASWPWASAPASTRRSPPTTSSTTWPAAA